MDGKYDILLGGESIGQAVVERQGLYYRFACRCRLTGGVIYRITVACGDRRENLGVPVPEGDAFVLTARLPVSRLGNGEPTFRAVPRHGDLEGKFIPLSLEAPFAYLSRLETAFLETRGGQLGVVVKD